MYVLHRPRYIGRGGPLSSPLHAQRHASAPGTAWGLLSLGPSPQERRSALARAAPVAPAGQTVGEDGEGLEGQLERLGRAEPVALDLSAGPR